MKKTQHLFLITLYLFAVSCGTDDSIIEEKETSQKSDEVKYDFSLNGELSTKNSPLKMQEESTDLFGIQVYDVTDATQDSEMEPYAYVIGNDISQVQINFRKERIYEILMVYVRNGQEVISLRNQEAGGISWGMPFNISNHALTNFNKVVYASSEEIYLIRHNRTMETNQGNRVPWLEVDRYDALIKSFKPEQDGVIDLFLKRTVFGLTLKIHGGETDVKEVRFAINRQHSNLIYPISIENGQGYLEIPYIALQGEVRWENDIAIEIYQAVLEDDYTEKLPIDIGTEDNYTRFFDGNLNVTRKTMHTLEFTLSENGLIQNGVEVQKEEGMNHKEINL